MRELRLWLLFAVGLGLVVGVATDLIELLDPGPLESAARILIVDNSLHRPIYRPAQQWMRYVEALPVDVMHAPSGDTVESLQDYTHMIITGSTASLVDPPAWADVEADFVRDAADLGLSILGSCFGHQMLVYALSGPEYVVRAASPEIGWVGVEMIAFDPLFDGVPSRWHTFAWHSDEVASLPDPWIVLGHTSRCSAAVIRFGERAIWGLQVHPETQPMEAKTLMLLQILSQGRSSPELCSALLQLPRDDRVLDVIMERFLLSGVNQDSGLDSGLDL